MKPIQSETEKVEEKNPIEERMEKDKLRDLNKLSRFSFYLGFSSNFKPNILKDIFQSIDGFLKVLEQYEALKIFPYMEEPLCDVLDRLCSGRFYNFSISSECDQKTEDIIRRFFVLSARALEETSLKREGTSLASLIQEAPRVGFLSFLSRSPSMEDIRKKLTHLIIEERERNGDF